MIIDILQLVESLKNKLTLNQIFSPSVIDNIYNDVKIIFNHNSHQNYQIPLLNQIDNYEDLVKYNGKLVRYVIMIQDVLDCEMHIGMLFKNDIDYQMMAKDYFAKYGFEFLKYRDAHDDSLINKYNIEEDSILMDRLNVLGIPVPNTNKWFLDSLTKESEIKMEMEKNEKYNIQTLIKNHFSKIKELKGFKHYNCSTGFPTIIKV